MYVCVCILYVLVYRLVCYTCYYVKKCIQHDTGFALVILQNRGGQGGHQSPACAEGAAVSKVHVHLFAVSLRQQCS